MAEKKKATKKVEKKEVKEAPKKGLKSNIEKWTKMEVVELKKELSILNLDLKSGKQDNTSLKKALRKVIARKLTTNNTK